MICTEKPKEIVDALKLNATTNLTKIGQFKEIRQIKSILQKILKKVQTNICFYMGYNEIFMSFIFNFTPIK